MCLIALYLTDGQFWLVEILCPVFINPSAPFLKDYPRGWLLRRRVQAVQGGGLQQHDPVHHGHHQSHGQPEDRLRGLDSSGRFPTTGLTLKHVLVSFLLPNLREFEQTAALTMKCNSKVLSASL